MVWLLDFVLSPLLFLPSFISVVMLSFLVSLISVVITKYATNQSVMKDLKDQLKAYQEQAKKLKENPEAAMDVQKKAMDVNMKYMMHNMRATLFTFLPIILIFGWMSSHLAFAPILSGQEFVVALAFTPDAKGNVTMTVPEGLELATEAVKPVGATVKYSVKAEKEGEYLLDLTYGGKTYSQPVVVGETMQGAISEKQVKQDGFQSIKIEYAQLKVIQFPFSLPLFGESLGWLGTYIIFAIVFSMVLRKLLKVH